MAKRIQKKINTGSKILIKIVMIQDHIDKTLIELLKKDLNQKKKLKMQ